MHPELIIAVFEEGERRPAFQIRNYTSTSFEGLTEEEVHDLRGRLQQVIWQFERERREQGRYRGD
jgi:hypothetical protein